jgi:hypothetical protein
LIVASSLTFYGFWRPEFALVMLASASTDYFVALRMIRSDDDRIRRRPGIPARCRRRARRASFPADSAVERGIAVVR